MELIYYTSRCQLDIDDHDKFCHAPLLDTKTGMWLTWKMHPKIIHTRATLSPDVQRVWAAIQAAISKEIKSAQDNQPREMGGDTQTPRYRSIQTTVDKA